MVKRFARRLGRAQSNPRRYGPGLLLAAVYLGATVLLSPDGTATVDSGAAQVAQVLVGSLVAFLAGYWLGPKLWRRDRHAAMPPPKPPNPAPNAAPNAAPQPATQAKPAPAPTPKPDA